MEKNEVSYVCSRKDIDSSVLILPKCSTVGLPSETRSISVCECLLPLWRGTRLYNRDFGVQGELFEPSFFLPEVKVETYVNCTPCQHHGLYLLKWCFAQPRQNVPVHPWGRGIKKLWDGNLCVLQSSSIINVDLRPGFYFSFFLSISFHLGSWKQWSTWPWVSAVRLKKKKKNSVLMRGLGKALRKRLIQAQVFSCLHYLDPSFLCNLKWLSSRVLRFLIFFTPFFIFWKWEQSKFFLSLPWKRIWDREI